MPVDPRFEAAFLTLSYVEKVDHYEWAVAHLSEVQKMTSLDHIALPLNQSDSVVTIKVKKGLKEGPAYKLQLGPYVLDCGGHYEIPLQEYLLRRSRSEKKVLILESIIIQ